MPLVVLDDAMMLFKEEGHSDALAKAVMEEYKRFLILKAGVQDIHAELLSPSLLVDRMWHFHILDVLKYNRDCVAILGETIGHNPLGGRGEDAGPRRRDWRPQRGCTS